MTNEIEANRLLELARKRYGTLTLSEITEELNIDPITAMQYLDYLKTKKEGRYYKEGEYYHFTGIESAFTKPGKHT